MSLDLCVACFRNGEPHPEPTALLRAPFDPLIGVADTAPHLPADMVEALGQPVVVTDGLAIRHWVENA